MPHAKREDHNRYIREYLRRRYEERRALAIEILGGLCVKCGATHDLQFDHIDHANKLFDVADRMAQYSWDRLVPEIMKCQLLCMDCHVDKSIIERHQKRAIHGTVTMYRHHKCRCEKCRAAWNANKAKYYRSRKSSSNARVSFARLNDV